MKINRKMLILIGTIFVGGIFIISIFSQYLFYSIPTVEIDKNINFFEPSREMKIYLLQKGKTIVLIYTNFSELSVEKMYEISNIFGGDVFFFLINSSFNQAFILSLLGERRVFNISYEILFKELCELSLEIPKECL